MAAQFFISVFSILVSTLTFASNQATFDISKVNCYQFRLDQNPESRKDAPDFTTQTWCYHQGKSSHEPLFVFNIDSKSINPETSFIVDEEAFFIVFSLTAGVVTYPTLNSSDFNPCTIPYEEPKNLKPIEKPQILNSQGEAVLNILIKNMSKPAATFSLQEGEVSVFAQSSILPWRGFWWPYKNQTLAATANSPLGKYDSYVVAHTNQPSNAKGWENTNHRYTGVWWEGHCNGWAASSILRRQPSYPKVDSTTGIIFSIDDQKGILAETDYCAQTAFYGTRYRGRSTDDKFDIHPALFHKTIMYYLGSLSKPVVMDYRSDSPVDNHPVSGYTMSIQKIDDHNFEVTATLNFHKYDTKRNLPPGIAPMYTRVYKYTLQQNDRGEIVGGLWRSANPDFVWVPLGILDCNSNNPYMLLDQVQNILNLPPAVRFPLVLFE